jgi:tRNA A37 methylthiotransferase MiaB
LHAANPVRKAVVDERMTVLRALAAEKSREHRKKMIGRELEAITLHTPAEIAARNQTAALTENFLPAELAGCFAANRLVRVRVTELNAEGGLRAGLCQSVTSNEGGANLG